MNHIYRLVWNCSQGAFVAVTETAKGRGKSTTTLGATVAAAVLAVSAHGATLPTGGQVTAGAASISSMATALTVNQSSQRSAINWQSFSVGNGASVNFVQPNASAVTLNRVVGTEQSVIAGALNANGQVFLLNSNGVLFTGTSSVNVGGLVASTLNVSDADFMAGRNTFAANGSKASVINLGTLNAADGGYVALLGNQVKNEGAITARLGTAVMAAGDQVSLNFNGNSLLGVSIDQGTLNALVENKQAVRADGGLVVLTAKGLDAVMATVVNNTGEIRAQTIANKEGKIYLLGGMDNNRIEVGGTLDASAPNGGNGGFVETSAAKVKFAGNVAITTKAASGTSGTWLIDPLDFTIAASGGDITGAALGTLLGSNSIQIETATAPTGTASNLVGASGTNGDIFVNDAVSWSANTALTLNAYRNININADITATGSNGKLALYYGQGAVAAGNTATYSMARAKSINLQAGQNFDTKLGSDGTAVNYTVLTSAAALQNMNSTLAGNFALGANVDLLGLAWTPIGTTYNTRFTGTFDGLGHTIDHLTMHVVSVATTVDVGLFGNVDTGINGLRNIGVTNASIDISGGNNVVSHVGVLAGIVRGGVNNTYATGTVNVSSSFGNANMRAGIGGLIGEMNVNGTAGTAMTTNSYADVAVDASIAGSQFKYVGGLVGYMEGDVSNSYATASVTAYESVGGLIGSANGNGSVARSFATGAVTGQKSGVGGLVGDNYLTIENSYASGQVNGTGTGSIGAAGGLVGVNQGAISNSYAAGGVNASTWLDTPQTYYDVSWNGNGSTAYIKGALIGADFGIWDNASNGYVQALSNNFYNSTVTGALAGIGMKNTFALSTIGGNNDGYTNDSATAAVGKTTSEMKTLATFSGTSPAWDIVIDPALSNVYPQLRWATNGLNAGSSVWVLAAAPVTPPPVTPPPVAPPTVAPPVTPASGAQLANDATKLADAIAAAIAAPETNFLPGAGQPGSFASNGTSGPAAGQPGAIVNVSNPLPEVSAAFGAGARFAVVSSPNEDEPTQSVSLSQARAMMQSPAQTGGGASGGVRDVRVPVSRNSLAEIVNGGVKLPAGVEQHMFVIQAK